MNNQKKIFINSISGVSQLLITTILTFISIPLFIQKLGTEVYGVFCLVSVVGNLNLFANLGLNISLLTFLSKQGKSSESNKDIIVTTTLLLAIITPLTLLAFWQDQYILYNILAVPPKYALIVTDFFHSLLLANGILLLGQIFVAVLDSRQKIYITSILQALYSSVYWIGLIISVSMGYSLPTIRFSILGAAIIWFSLLLFFTAKEWGKPFERMTIQEIKRISLKHLSFGSKVSFAGFVGFFFEPLSKILISNFLGVHAVASYDIALKIKTQIMGVFQKMLYPLYPHFSNKDINEQLKVFLFSLFKKLILICGVISVAIFYLFPFLLNKWLGGDNYTTIVYSIAIIVSTLMFSAPIIPIYSFFQVKLKPTNNIIIQLSSVFTNILAFLLIVKFEVTYSIVISNIISSFVGFTFCIVFWNKFPGFPQEKRLHSLNKSFLLIISLFVFCQIFSIFLNNDIIRFATTCLFILFGSIFFSRIFRLFEQEELEELLKFSPILSRLFVKVLISA